MNKKIAFLAVIITISILVSGFQNSMFYGTQYMETKSEFTFSVASSVDWYDCNWSYSKKIIINHDKVQSTQTNYPVLIYRSSDTDLATNAQTDGGDIIFIDRYNTTQYKHEIESYNSGIGELTAWVKIPSLSAGSNTILYMYYGNPTCSNQQNITATWDSNFKTVQHLNESTGTLYDSTSNDNDGTNNGATYNSSGKINGSYDFDGNDNITINSDNSLNITGSITLEGWVKDPPLENIDKQENKIRIIDKKDEKILTYPSKSFTVERTISTDYADDAIFVALFSPNLKLNDMLIKEDSIFEGIYHAGNPLSKQEQNIESIRINLPEKLKELDVIAYSKIIKLKDKATIRMQFSTENLNNLLFDESRISYLVFTDDSYDFEGTTYLDKTFLWKVWDPFSSIFGFIENIFGKKTKETKDNKPIDTPTKNEDLYLPPEIKGKIDQGEEVRVIIRLKEDSQENFNEKTSFLESMGFEKTAEIDSEKIVAGFIDKDTYEQIKQNDDVEAFYSDDKFEVLLKESLPIISFGKAFEEFGVTGKNKKICIIDTGVNSSLVNYSYGYDFVNEDTIPDDEHGHGTMVASVIKNIAPDVELVVAKVIGKDGIGFESDVLAGLEWSIAQNPDIICFSIGSEDSCNGFCDEDFVADMCNDAVDTGIFVIAAAGNDGEDKLKSPACGSNVFSVGSTEDNDEIASFSSVNPTLDIFAPGVEIKTITGTGSGTSFSVPFVVGAAALLLEKEKLNIQQLKNRLKSTGKPTPYKYNESLNINIPRLDIYNALSNTITMQPYNYSNWWQCTLTGEEYEPLGMGWLSVSSGNYSSASCGEDSLQGALDGDMSWFCERVEFPANFVLDLGANYVIDKVQGRSNKDHDPIDVDVLLSYDGSSFFEAVSDIGNWSNTETWGVWDMPGTAGRYVKVVVNDTEAGADPKNLEWGVEPTPENFLTIFDVYAEKGNSTIYYFDSNTGEIIWQSNWDNMNDSNENTWADTQEDDQQILDENTCSGTDLGTITQVDIRAKGYYQGAANDILLIPRFSGESNGDSHEFDCGSTAAWSQWFDITTDSNAPDPWTWNDVAALDCDVSTDRDAGGEWQLFCSKVEIRVKFNESASPAPNNAPSQSNEGPTNTTPNQDVCPIPTLNVTCIDNDGDTMNATWWSNSSNSWVQFASNTTISNNSNIIQTNNNFSNYSTTYWWSVNLSDGEGGWNNETYHFTTENISTNVNSISPYEKTESSLELTATGDSCIDNVTLYYRYAADNYSWWNENWTHRKKHIINSCSGAGENYQVGIKVYYGSGTDGTETYNGVMMGKIYCNNNCQADFDDIRFIADDNTTVLDYWQEEKTDSTNATYWVEISDDLNSSGSTIFVYYGNDTASSLSNGTDTFVYFDDFSGALNKWTTIAGTWSSAGGILKSTGSTSGRIGLYYTGSSIKNASVDAKIYFPDSDSDQTPGLYIRGDGTLDAGSDNKYLRFYWHTGYTPEQWQLKADDSFISQVNTPNANNLWGIVSTRFTSGDVMKDYWNNTKIVDTTSSLGSSTGRVGISAYYQTATCNNAWVDDWRTRKYIDPEPTHGNWGDEESWMIWSNANNPDTDYASGGWNWTFDYPNGTGYYEFYSIGDKDGSTAETAPNTKDASCYYKGNTAPEITNPYPSSQSTDISVNPTLNITVNDTDGDSMTITWYSNSSGSWQKFGTNSSVGNGTYQMTNNNFSNYSKTYYWNVTVTDGTTTNTSDIFWFITETIDTSIDSINPYEKTVSTLELTATGPTDIDNVTLWYRYSADNSTWWNSSWTYRKKLTIDHNQVDEDLTNFPILVNITDSKLSSKAQSDGDDIVFTNATGTKLNHEIELFNSTTGELVSWVNVTSLSSSIDTELYLYYGNNSCSNQENVAETWDSNYVLVYHLDETCSGSGGTIYDSTENNNDGTTNGGLTTDIKGVVDGAVDMGPYNGDDWITASTSTSLNMTSQLTISIWMNSDSWNGDRNMIIDKGEHEDDPPSNSDGWSLTEEVGIMFRINKNAGSVAETTTEPSLNTWYYITGTYDGSFTKLYFNKSLMDSNEFSDSIATNPDNFYIGSGADRTGNDFKFDGTVDEVQISDIARSWAWINTSYNSMNSPETFLNTGSQESWMQWDDTGNPDTDYKSGGWNWIFDYPNGTGYYEFYSIGKKDGSTDESEPNTADTTCYYNPPVNNPPTQTNPGPTNGSTSQSITPALNVTCIDNDGDTMSATWWSNSSNSWVQFASNASISNKTSIKQTNNNFSNYSITYYWSVNLTDGQGGWNNETYHFTTEPIDTSIDSISPYEKTASTISLTATGPSDIDNVTLWYRYSTDNSTWWNSSFTYRKKLTIDHNKIETDLTNYPILASIIDSNFTTKVQTDGDDFVFTNSTGTKLNHEIDLFNVSNGELVAWVNVTSLSSSIDTEIYLYYGNSSCSSQQNIAGTWHSDYKAVWHFNQTSGSYLDSTSNNNDGTLTDANSGSIRDAEGIVAGCIDLEGDADYISKSSYSGIDIEEKTFICWLNPEDTTDWDRIFTKDNTGDQDWGVVFYDNDILYDEDSAPDSYYGSDGVSTSYWQMYSVVAPTTEANVVIYYNKTKQTINNVDDNVGTTNSPTGFTIGARQTHAANYFNGKIDEMQIISGQKSWEWINSTYNMISAPSSFLSSSNEERWYEWNDANNPDTDYVSGGWNWTFDYPNGTGYYEFYSIGDKTGSTTETAPNSADAACYYRGNTAPEIANPYPSNQSTDISVNPTLNITVNDTDGDSMTIKWYSNSSGTWKKFGTNTTETNGTFYMTNTNFTNYSITYYWNVTVNDGTTTNTSDIFWFTTEVINTSIDSITPYEQTSSTLSLTATGPSDIDNVTLFFRQSTSNHTWWNISFDYRNKITIDHNQVSEDLTNFPILVSITDTNLSNKAQSDGDDIVFTDSTGTKLNHEIENFTSGTGKLIAWVNVTSLSSTTDTIIYMYYGNSMCNNQQNIEGTWDSDYTIVQHLNETNSTDSNNFKDSTSNNNDGTLTDSDSDTGSVSGKIGKAIDFAGDSEEDVINCGTDSSLDVTSYTIECWLKADGNPGADDSQPINKGDDNYLFSWSHGTAGFQQAWTHRDGDWPVAKYTTALKGSIWYHLVGTYNETSDILRAWLNGSIDTTTGSVTTTPSDTGTLYLGGYPPADGEWEWAGILDEFRVSNFERSDAWIQTTYNTMENTTTFVTTGNEEQWYEWNDASNPDTDYVSGGWNWTFDYPNGTGYYEFYSIGDKSGSTTETAPNTKDAQCYYRGNTAPEITNPYPSNQSTSITVNPTLNITVNDTDEDAMTITWYSNSSGSWQKFGKNTSVGNGTYQMTNSNFTNFSKTFYWNVTVNDGTTTNTSDIFWFTTIALSTSIDSITPYNKTTSPYQLNATVNDQGGVGGVENITLWYTFSSDNVTWWNSSWKYRKKITIDHNQVEDSLSNFPMLVNITDTNLSNKAQSDGDDIVFTDSSSNKLNHEIENYTSATGNLIAWVNVTSVSSSTDTEIWIYYGNSTCESQQNPTDVWDSDYAGIWHMNTTSDSSTNGNDATNSGAAYKTGGKISGCYDFELTDSDYMSVDQDESLNITGTLTVSAWVRAESIQSYSYILERWGPTKDTEEPFGVVIRNTPTYFFEWGDGSGYSEESDSTTFSTATWYYVTFVFDFPSTTLYYYKNGVQFDTDSVSDNLKNYTGGLYLGAQHENGGAPSGEWDGYLDEIRISKIARNSSWITTEYNNQQNQSSFISTGTEENWKSWDDESNPDTESTWNWNFDFPDSYGYYQFYSIGNDTDGNTEDVPSGIADAKCRYMILDNDKPFSNITGLTQYWYNETDNPITITLLDSDDGSGSGVASVSLKYYNSTDNSTWTGPNTYGSDDTDPWDGASWSFTFPNSTGWYRLQSIATDNNSNVEDFETTNDTEGGYDNYKPSSSVDSISPYTLTSSKTITATANDEYNSVEMSGLKNITLWYRYSNDNFTGLENWWNNSWKYRKLITLNSSKVNQTLINFPVMIYRQTDSNLSSNAQTDGDDICFILWNDNSTKLNHEIELYDSGTGKLVSWVNISSLSSSSDTKIWMYYGNNNCNSQENIANTWDSDYESVWHFNETSGTSLYDATNNNNDGTHTGTIYTGITAFAGYSYFIDGSSGNYIDSDSSITSLNPWTLETWFKHGANSDGGDWGNSFCCDGDGHDFPGQFEKSGGQWYYGVETQGLQASCYMAINDDNTTWFYATTVGDSDKAWVYDNGTLSDVQIVDAGDGSIGGNDWTIGIRHSEDSEETNLTVDEMRLSKIKRNESWINTTHNTIRNPSDFHYYGSEQVVGWANWSDASNPDTASPWQWTFDFENSDGTGYYEFYSIANDSVLNEENVPSTADAICYYRGNTAPEITNPYPSNQSTDITVNPTLNITVNDTDQDSMTITWYSNSSGSWQKFGTNTTETNGTFYMTNTNFTNYSITYYWNVTVNDGTTTNTSDIFWFTTEVINTSIDSITPYEQTSSTLSLTATGPSDIDNVTLFFRQSTSNHTWWNISFDYRNKITIDHNQVSEDLTNFPILVNITDTNLSSKAQSDGDDIVFTDSTGTKLNHEIENFTSETGELIAWVNVTSLCSTTDTIIYMYYGNTTCSSQENAADTWNSNYAAVWHLNDIDGNFSDSTSNNNYAITGGDDVGNATGKISNCTDFDGDDDYIYAQDSTSLNSPSSTENITIEVWVRSEGNDGNEREILRKGLLGDNAYVFRLDDTGPDTPSGFIGGSWINDGVGSGTTIVNNVWYFMTMVYDGTDVYFYINGSEDFHVDENDGIDSCSEELTIGNHNPENLNRDWNGKIDELRISNSRRNISWISTTYNTMQNTTTFVTTGNEEQWYEWNSASNPDTDYTSGGWNWTFNFPNGSGYYEFYSIGKKDGSTDETSPNTKDASCYYPGNAAPTIELISPANSSTEISLQPICQIWANDTDGDNLDIYWYENTTDSWVLRQTNDTETANSTITWTYTQANSYFTTYYWKVAVNDSKENISKWFSFTTINDTTKPTITFNEPPTPEDDKSTSDIYANISVSVTDESNVSSFIDWNNSLVGYWNFEYYNSTDVFDNSSNNNNGSFNGGLGTADITDGKFGNAIEFNGTSDFINISDNPLLDGFTENATFEFWTKLNSLPTNGNRQTFICKYYTSDGERAYFVEIYNDGGTQQLRFFFSEDGTNYKYATESYSFTIDTWYHIAIKWISGSNPICWINSEKRTFDSVTGTTNSIRNSPRPLNIGRSTYDSNRDLNGLIDEIKIWNRSLSWEEINASYNASSTYYKNFTELSIGSYSYYAYAIDAAGNHNQTSIRTFNVKGPNTAPAQSNEGPINGSTSQAITPTLNVTCTDTDGDTMNATWWSNSSGNWKQFANNNTSFASETNIIQTNSNFSGYNITYWWSVNLSDGEGGWNNETYYFTTEIGNPTIITNTTIGKEETNVTLKGFLNDDGNDTTICGFYLDTTSGGESTNITYGVVSEKNEFSYDATGINPGQLYYYSAWAKNVGGFTTGSELTFLTKPNATVSGSLTIQTNSSSVIYLTWTAGDGANTTYIERNTSGVTSWDRGQGEKIYNGTASSYEDTGLSPGINYYYQLWSYTTWTYNPTIDEWSDGNESGSNETKNKPVISNISPTNQSTGISLNPTLQIQVNHSDEYKMDITWYWGTDSSCPNLIGSNNSKNNGTYSQPDTDSNFSTNSQTYYWKVCVNDSQGEWTNETYHFTTIGANKQIISKGQSAYSMELSPECDTLYGYINSNVVSFSTDTNIHYFVITFDGNNIKLYIDGQYKDQTGYVSSINTNANDLIIGDFLTGTIDEVRVSSTARSAQWINTTYQNTNDPETFASFGTQKGILSTWTYRKQIWINASMIDEDLNNFPVLISTTDNNLKNNALSTGNDIIFVPTTIDWSTGSHADRLAHEVEKYDSSTGELVAWVNITSISSTTNTSIYMYYGNTLCTSNRENTAGVWDSNYIGIWHFNNSLLDSTSNDIDWSDTGTADLSSGEIAGCRVFDDSGDELSATHKDILNMTTAISVEMWYYPTGGTDSWDNIVYKGDKGSPETVNYQFAQDDGILQFDFGETGDWHTLAGVESVTASTWYYVVWTYDSNQGYEYIYINGSQDNSRSENTAMTGWTGTDPLEMFNGDLTGRADEVRLSKIRRSTNWINASYNTTNDPSNFVAFGNQQIINFAPEQSSPNPSNSATGQSLTPTLSITVNDANADQMDVYFYTNSTGSWGEINSNLSVYNGTFYQTNDSMDSYNTKYWWSVNASDGTTWKNVTYSFTTTAIYFMEINSTSDDGYILTDAMDSWDKARNATTGNDLDTTCTDSNDAIQTQNFGGFGFYIIWRSFFEFNTSVLPDNAIVSEVYLNVWQTTVSGGGTRDAIVIKSTQGDTLEVGDFDEIDFDTPYSAEITGWTVLDYDNITLNSDGINAVNITGNTYLAMIEHDHDYLDITEPATNAIGLMYSEGDNPPYLSVKYTLS